MRSEKLFTTREAAERCQIEAHIVRAAVQRKLLSVQPTTLTPKGRRSQVLIAESDLNRWLETRQFRRTARATRPARPAGGAQCRHSDLWAKLVSETRIQKGLTRTELAARARVCPSYICFMEQGAVPKRAYTLAVGEALGLDANACLLACGYSPMISVAPELLRVLAQLTVEEQRELAARLESA